MNIAVRSSIIVVAMACGVAACSDGAPLATVGGAPAQGLAAPPGSVQGSIHATGRPGSAGGVLPGAGRPAGEGFATLADRGDLVGYPKQRVARSEGPRTWHRADVSEAHALQAIATGVLTLTAPSGARLRFAYDRHVEHPSGDWTWIGHAIDGNLADDAVLTFGADAVFGTIAQAGQPALKLAMQDGASWLVETDANALAAQSKAAGRYDEPDFLLPPDLPVVQSLRAQAAAVSGAQASVATTTVDVVVGYTTGFEQAYTYASNTGPALTRLNFLVDVTNESYANSQVPTRVRMVHALKVAYPDNNENKIALRALTGSDGTSTPTLSNVDVALRPLHTARDQYGADLVSLVRDFQHPEAVSCGVAWLIGGGQSTIHSGYAPYGMSVVSDGADGGFYCEDTTFAHELGHNMGLAHDIETAKGDDGVLDPDDYGRYPYSFGYRTDPANGNFYTVMAYNEDQVNHYRVFSNPDITICGGFPCGLTGQADNALTLRQTSPIIAGFRAQVVPLEPVGTIDRDINGDGRADLLWYNPAYGPATAHFQPWHMNGSTWTYGNGHLIGSSKYRVAGVGDFNGDGRADLLWRDDANTELYAWLMKADGTKDTVYLRGFPTGWKIAGVADINGDGRDDVFWYNATLGRTQAWYMNGATWVYGPVGALPANTYDVGGVADFSGDGRADVVWFDYARTTLWLWAAQPDGSFTVHFLRDYPAGWSIAGTGDANADFRSDIFWHNEAAGLQQTWLMNGAIWTYGAPFGIPSQYQVGAIDDFNGDGRADIMWHDNAHAWLWTAKADGGYTVGYLRTYPTGWQVVNAPY